MRLIAQPRVRIKPYFPDFRSQKGDGETYFSEGLMDHPVASSKDALRMIFGMKVQQLRQRHQLSLKELAARSGLSPSYLNEIEKGKKYPSLERILKIASALEVEYHALISDEMDAELDPIASVVHSKLIRDFPFHLFGIKAQELVQIMAKVPKQMGVFAQMLMDVAHGYDMKVDDFYHAALRSFQLLNDNHFPDLEAAARAFRQKHHWQLGDLPEAAALLEILQREYKYRVVRSSSGRRELEALRTLLLQNRQLILNPEMSSEQQSFALARELGFLELGLSERAPSSPALEYTNFEQVFANFQASYFAGAVLMPQATLVADLKNWFSAPEWEPAALVRLLRRYGVTPESFFHRMSELLPQDFGIKKLHFLKFTRKSQPNTNAVLSKQLNMSKVFIPEGISLREHFCARWLSLAVIDELEQHPELEYVIEAQRSSFFHATKAFFCIALAYRGVMHPTWVSSVTLGFQVDPHLSRVIRFVDDPAVSKRELGQTCERCPLEQADCEQRLAPNELYRARLERAAKRKALQEVLEQSLPLHSEPNAHKEG